MLTYLILIVTSVIIGLVAVLLYSWNGRKDKLDPHVFLTAALLNAGAQLGILLYQKRRKQ
jgi:hypothetical protein